MWELITSLFGGGVTGLIGSIVTQIFAFKTKKLDLEASRDKYLHEREMREVDAKIMAQEWSSRIRVAEVEGASQEEVANARAFEASFNESAKYSGGITPTPTQGWLLIGLDFARGIVRPGLTVYLCLLTTLLYVDAHRLLRAEDFTQTQAELLVTRVINMILYLTTVVVTWWFGTRIKTSLNVGQPNS